MDQCGLDPSSVRHSSNLLGGEQYARDAEDPRFTDTVGAIQSIVTSSGQNDSGLFETNLRDERYLPFEGAGAISEWRIELPSAFRQFDYDTISDVILHVRYTARAGGGLLAQQATNELQTALDELVRSAGETGLARLLSVRHEFPTEWHRFLNPAGADDLQTLTLALDTDRFPFVFAGRTLTIGSLELLLKVKPAFAETHNESTVRLALEPGDTAPTPTDAEPGEILALSPWEGMLRAGKTFGEPPGTWTLNAWFGRRRAPRSGCPRRPDRRLQLLSRRPAVVGTSVRFVPARGTAWAMARVLADASGRETISTTGSACGPDPRSFGKASPCVPLSVDV
jgi:Tc toxin complex TcA C-terminal TcB-binding domain